MDFKIIVSIGPSLTGHPDKLRKIDSYSDCIYRINGAHVNADSIPSEVAHLRDVLPDAKIMIDLPGNKIRLKGLVEPIQVIKGELVELYDYQTNFQDFHKYVKPGDIILTNDSLTVLEVKKVEGSIITILPHSDGLLVENKGFHVSGISDSLPFLLKNDLDLINVAYKEKLDFISLSFVRTAEDIKEFKKIRKRHKDHNMQFISKIETEQAVKNLDDILNEVEHINIDRGDLSADIGMENLPSALEKIISSTKKKNKNVFVATQFLKSMESKFIPLISELCDLHSTIKSGVSGIQLSEETTIGKYPEKCVKLVADTFKQILKSSKS